MSIPIVTSHESPLVLSPVLREGETSGHSPWVSHVEGVAEELMAWDTKEPKWTKAVHSCVEAFEDRVSPQVVRQAISRLSRRYHGNSLVRPSGVRED
nr:DUF982 domain-containing protein [Mesorhizobium sp.]